MGQAEPRAIIGPVPSPKDLPDDIAALNRIIAETARDAAMARAGITRPKFQLARHRRTEFGRSSEPLARETERLGPAIEAPETNQAERLSLPAALPRRRAGPHRRSPARQIADLLLWNRTPVSASLAA